MTGHGISKVQFCALSVLELLDKIVKIDEHDRQLRLAMLASGRYDAEVLFPDIFATVETDDSAELPAEVDMHGEAIATKYDFSNAQFDPKRVEEEIAEMMARAAASEASLGDIHYDEWV